VVLDFADSDEGFSGFGPEDIPIEREEVIVTSDVMQTNKKKDKSSTKQVKSKPKQTKKKNSKKPTKPVFNIDSLSQADLETLRSKLMLDKPGKNSSSVNILESEDLFEPDYIDSEDYENVDPSFREDFRRGRNMRVSFNRADLSDSESEFRADKNVTRNKDMSKNLLSAMFGSDSDENVNSVGDEWIMPQLKVTQKGESINSSLASLINVACTTPCETEKLVLKYPVPKNCEMLPPPLINQEVWKVLDKRTRSYDHLFVEIQNLLATGMVPVIKLVTILKDVISKNDKAKELISECLTLFGQAQYQLSLRRRYLIRPSIKKKYRNLCNQSTPVTSQLFGDDIAKEIKNCDAGTSIALSRFDYDNKPFKNRVSFRGRGRRFHPYYGNNRTYQSDYQTPRWSNFKERGSFRGRRRPSATVTSSQRDVPNE
jgi:hypothetical protein